MTYSSIKNLCFDFIITCAITLCFSTRNKTKCTTMRLPIFRYLIYITITWFLLQFYRKLRWFFHQIKLKRSKKNFPEKYDKAELLQLKPHPSICMRNLINKKSWKSKKLSPLLLYPF